MHLDFSLSFKGTICIFHALPHASTVVSRPVASADSPDWMAKGVIYALLMADFTSYFAPLFLGTSALDHYPVGSKACITRCFKYCGATDGKPQTQRKRHSDRRSSLSARVD